MTSNSNKKKNLLDQQVALHSYLDDLLQGIPDAEEPQSVSVSVNESEQGESSVLENNAGSKNKHGFLRKQEKQIQGQDVQPLRKYVHGEHSACYSKDS